MALVKGEEKMNKLDTESEQNKTFWIRTGKRREILSYKKRALGNGVP